MAGKYNRFKKAGYTKPKFLLPFSNDLTIFQEIMKELVNGYNFENVIFIANTGDIQYKEDIEKIIKASDIISYTLLFSGDTKGQAETAVLGVNALVDMQCKSKKIIIHNIDTILYARNIKKIDDLLNEYNGYIDVFEAKENCYSYVKTDHHNVVTEIKEKIVISNKATSGLYAFSDMNEYMRYYKQLKINEEYYISYIYDLMLQDKNKITVNEVMEKTIILGTPEEYENRRNLI